jgi:hypothetical protein
VESTGSFGATLTRSLTAAGEGVIEANRPNWTARHRDGKPGVLAHAPARGRLKADAGHVNQGHEVDG